MNDSQLTAAEKTKKYLRRYRKNNLMIERLENKLARLDEQLYTISSPRISDLPKGGTRRTSEDIIVDKIEVEERINRLCEKGHNIKLEIVHKLDELDDPRYADVLELYFIDCLTFEEIATVKGYTIRHVFRLYNAAINTITI